MYRQQPPIIPLYETICPYCGKRIFSESPRRKWCNHVCRDRHARMIEKASQLAELTTLSMPEAIAVEYCRHLRTDWYKSFQLLLDEGRDDKVNSGCIL